MSATDTSTAEEQASTSTVQRGGLRGWMRRIFGAPSTPSTNYTQPIVTQETYHAAETQPAATSDEPQYVVAPGGYRIRIPQKDGVHHGIGEMLPKVKDAMSLIPPFPQLLVSLLGEIQKPLATATSVGNIAANDPALAASLIRTVNSAAFGLNRKITSVAEAVNYMGFSNVKAMVLRLQLETSMGGNTGSDPDLQDLWVHSLVVSHVADCLARRVPGVDRGFASTLGLLHDIGKLIIHTRFPQEAQQLRAWRATDESQLILAEEKRLLGVNHADLGANVAAQWGLPADLIRAIRFHHAPNKAFEVSDPKPLHQAMYVVQIANQLAKYCYVYADQTEIDAIDPAAFDSLRFGHELTALLDDDVRAAISRAIFIAQDGTPSSTPTVRRFLRLNRGESALQMLAAMAGSDAPTRVEIDDESCAALFQPESDTLKLEPGHHRLRAAATANAIGIANVQTEVRKHLNKLPISPEAQLPLMMVARCLLANVPQQRSERLEVVTVVDGQQVQLAVRAPGLSFASRFGADCDRNAAAHVLDSELANVLNLKWFDSIRISSDGGTLVFSTQAA
jgi:putative nucleotidyltransferase with HDIG domain